MTEPAFIDANVLLYLSGAAHPLRQPALDVYRAIGTNPKDCWASAEVLQEILHVCLRRGQGHRAAAIIEDFVAILGQQVVPLLPGDVLWTLDRPLPSPLQARDRVHLAVMARLGISKVISADVAFDSVVGIQRLAPEQFGTWRESVFSS